MKNALVIDDHPVAHLGCGQILRDAGYSQVLEALNAGDACRLAEVHQPSIIVLDLGLPAIGGLNLIEPLLRRAPEARILVFSMNEQMVFVSKCLAAGARGYLSKNASPEAFHKAISALERGELFLEAPVAISIASMKIGGKADPLSSLTEREYQALRLIGQGEDLQSVADSLHVSYKTAANTSSAIKKKLGVRRTSELIRLAIENNLV